ncbi:MAG: universal stress protein [Deferrisomatales bacterium]|nr:universal stress protein [Deferrisomatales bacterium]
MHGTQFKKILVPTDFSDYSARGICAAISMARHFDSDLYFVNVWPPEFMFEAELRAKVDAEVKRRLEEETRKREDKLKTFVEEFDISGIRAHYLIKSGPPYLEIIIAARELEVDLIIIGTHGLTGLLASMLIGSVAEKVVHRASCPVMTIRPEGFECDELVRHREQRGIPE